MIVKDIDELTEEKKDMIREFCLEYELGVPKLSGMIGEYE